MVVVAPVPLRPSIIAGIGRYGRTDRIPRVEEQQGLVIRHPRFLTVPKIAKTLDGVFMAQSCWATVRELFRDKPFDVIDAHWAYPDGVAAAILGRRLRVPVAITVRGDDLNVFAEQPFRKPWIRWALKSAAVVLALSRELKSRVESLTGGAVDVRVVPNGVDTERFKPRDRTEARRHLGIPADTTLLLSVGRLHRSKGFPLLVKAMAHLRERFGPIALAVVGDSDPEADARAEIANVARELGLSANLLLPGSLDPDALVHWYSAADLFCLATIREGSPNVLLEALSCGLPCVATAVGGIPEVLSSDLGVLTGAAPTELAESIARALTHQWDRAAIRGAVTSRSWNRVGLECCEALGSVIARASAA
jgi:glycosyltransferase involved in cell wall biosynthesis